MQRRTIWIIGGSIAGVLLVMCLVLGGAVWFLGREVQRQQEDVANIFATIEAGLESASTSPAPGATATPSSAAPAEVPSPTAVSPSAPAERAAAPTNTDGGTASEVSAALVPRSQPALTERANATRYQIEATLEAEGHTITGEQTTRLTNTEGVALDELYFRLYVNAPHYNEGGIAVTAVEVDGAPATTTLEADDTVLRIALPRPLEAGQTAEITMRFTTTVPQSGGGYGIFNEAEGVFTLYNWHPEVAVYEDGGWKLNPVTEQGDPTNTDASNYEVSFSAPEGFAVITSGAEIGQSDGGSTVAHRSVAALARNFVVVASDRYEQLTREVSGTKVSSYYLPGNDKAGQAVLDTSVKSLEIFGAAFGPYPYTELDVTEVVLGGGAAGMEATGLIMIGSDLYDAESRNPLGESGGLFGGAEGADALVFTTAHEVAHQWWYGVVGSDAYEQPWLDESLTNWSSAYYVDQAISPQAGLVARDLFIGLSYRMVLAEGDQRLDQPVDKFDSPAYGGIVYGKGALMYDVLRKELGEQKFFEFLRRYYREQQFERADSDEWLQTLNAVAGKDMTPFYQKWVEGQQIEPSDLPASGPLGKLLGGFEGALPGGDTAP